jgi:formate hydrogenlyase subunit 6/NADH:ubiquinone oxidoreductase subunit I
MSYMSKVPGWGIATGMAHTFVRFLRPKVTVQYPEQIQEISPKHRGRLILLYDERGNLKCETCFQCAAACPIEIIDMGGVDTKTAITCTGARPSSTPNGARSQLFVDPAGRYPMLPSRRGFPSISVRSKRC